MTYVERILQMQAEVAAELQPEADEALTVYHWSVGVRPEAGTQDLETEPGTAEALSLPADMQTPDRPGKADGAEPLLLMLRAEDGQAFIQHATGDPSPLYLKLGLDRLLPKLQFVYDI